MYYLSYIPTLLWALRYTIHCTTTPLTTTVKLALMFWSLFYMTMSCFLKSAIFQLVTSSSCHRVCLYKNASFIFSHSVAKPVLISLSISADKLISYCETPQSLVMLPGVNAFQFTSILLPSSKVFPFIFFTISYMALVCMIDSFYAWCFILSMCLATSHLSFELPEVLRFSLSPLLLVVTVVLSTRALIGRRDSVPCSPSSPTVPPSW